MKTLLVDNHDSYTYNVFHLLAAAYQAVLDKKSTHPRLRPWAALLLADVERARGRNVRARGCEQASHAHERAAVFLVGRCVHHDAAAAVGGVHAQVPPEAGIGRGWPDGGGL